MLIPPEILIGGHKVATLLIFAAVSLLYWVFIVWYEGRKDGFESDKVLDLAAASIIVSSLFFYFYNLLYRHTAIYNPGSPILRLDYGLTGGLLAFIGSLVPVLMLSSRWSWSKYRLLDIYAMACSLFIFLFGLGRFVIYLDIKSLGLSALILPFYLLILRYRGYRFPSGVMFSFFTVFLAVFGIAALGGNANLPLYVILFILSIVNLFFRSRRSMYKRNLPAEFINALKSKLQAKDKNLKDSQQLLVKEDPYLQEDRATGNSEEMDEAILEDYQKSINDAETGIVKRLRVQVKKALAAIKIGKYGVCEICGKPIDKARLRAYPEATTCIDCASKKKPGPEDE